MAIEPMKKCNTCLHYTSNGLCGRFDKCIYASMEVWLYLELFNVVDGEQNKVYVHNNPLLVNLRTYINVLICSECGFLASLDNLDYASDAKMSGVCTCGKRMFKISKVEGGCSEVDIAEIVSWH